MCVNLGGHKIDSKHVAQQSARKNHHVLKVPLSLLSLLKFLNKTLLVLLQFLDQKMVFFSELIIFHQRFIYHSI